MFMDFMELFSIVDENIILRYTSVLFEVDKYNFIF